MNSRRDELIADEAPIFNIGVVSRMTNIPETTLRAWERRYDFPKATRTTGGHRLYSEQEIARLQWVKARVDTGMQVSQAIRVLNHSLRERQDANGLPPPEPVLSGSESSEPIDLFCQRLVNALAAYNALEADQVIAEAYALFSIESIILEIIGPTFYEIGEAWSRGDIDVATEHYASNYLRIRLYHWLEISPPAYRVSPVVLACAPGELHEGSLLMLAVLLRRLRWPVIYLGQTVPLTELARFLESVDAAIIVFVAMTEAAADALAGWPQWLPGAVSTNRPVVGYGGRAFLDYPETAQPVPGVLLGITLQDGLANLNRMLHETNPLLR